MVRLRHIVLLGLLCVACGGRVQAPGAVEGRSLEESYRAAARLRGAGLAAVDAADWTVAIESFTQLESTLPDNLIAPLNLAVCHLQAGDLAAAEEAAQRARGLAPDNPRLLYALARIQDALGDREGWEQTLDHYVAVHPRDPRPHFLRLRSLEERGEPSAAYGAADLAVRAAYDNLVLLVDRLVVAAQAGLVEETADALDAVEDRLDGFDPPLLEYAEELRSRASSGTVDGLLPRALVVRNILRPSDLYRQHLIPLAGPESSRGIFVQLDFEPPLPKFIQGGKDIDIAFSDPSPSGDPELPGALRSPLRLAVAEQRDALLADSGAGLVQLLRRDGAWASELVSDARADRIWSTLDFDQDGLSDLIVEDRGALVLQSAASPPTTIFETEAPILAVYAFDIDLEGDLDLVVAQAARTRFLRNNGDRTWSEDSLLLSELTGATLTDLRCVDLDDDGDLDVVAATDSGLRVLDNRRVGALQDVSSEWGLARGSSAGARLEIEDFDADGRFDVLAWSDTAHLYSNNGRTFVSSSLAGDPTLAPRALAVADFDNDGDRDLVVVSDPSTARLLRNRGTGFEAERLDVDPTGVTHLVPGDFDGDGDIDLVATRDDEPRYWRNEGGSLNHWLRLELHGRTENNSKNNSQGLSVRIESRVGGDYQTILGNGGVNHIGLGAARQVDALRVIWTNGLAQTWAGLAADQSLDEEQVLKGSCPFLYTWNGQRFEFVTDLMWKSPLGMVLADGTPAPHQSAKDWVLIPGERLVPVDGELWLQVTEELWETVYVDRQQLLAVDHPANVELVVDEKFTVPPHPVGPQLHWVERSLSPVAARDQERRDVLDRIRDRDDRHVDGLPLSRYQGVTAGHSLELDFPARHSAEPVRLILWGWIFPTDTSINTALAQGETPGPSPPRLELATADGEWRTLATSIGFPSGKRKALVVDLGTRLPAGAVTLRLTTEMQIYWDAARLVIGHPPVRPVVTPLEPRSAHLHLRGFSRLYRTSDSGPHLFDYSEVSTAPRFRDLAGLYTRFGPVGELLLATDDRYVVMNAGDELTVRYPARQLPELPAGWRRDFVLHTDGWVKDGDIHTSHSQAVAPLPYHGMTSYPDRPWHRFPRGPEHESWRATYQTRRVDDEAFRAAIRGETQTPRQP